jgi:hypothetical protein
MGRVMACFMVLALGISGTGRGDSPIKRACTTQSKGDQCEDCYHKDRYGKCVLDDNCSEHDDTYKPHGGEQCWVMERCWCEEGQRPGSDSCSPCQYGGRQTICRHY